MNLIWAKCIQWLLSYRIHNVRPACINEQRAFCSPPFFLREGVGGGVGGVGCVAGVGVCGDVWVCVCVCVCVGGGGGGGGGITAASARDLRFNGLGAHCTQTITMAITELQFFAHAFAV